jgi:hypothetical protein
MGTSESKSEYAVDAKQTSFCCDQNRKDSEIQRRKFARSKSSSVGRNESVQIPSSVFTPWMTQPEQNDAGHEAVTEKVVSFQDSLKSVVLSENSSDALSSIPKKGVKTAALPYGWTAAQSINLKDSVHRTASVFRSKPPGFFVVQVS